ncbi:MAG: imidazole glycerol phosphate synthase subunit HisF [Clostridia bacterium]|nr:imidazole glycerol phosphate synthase subunit HisF [Clostridia bacterium]MDD3093452.1 imidazole glycerol phosphate synthase subunit HisF [Clostridia bacterium]MDD3971968.1 imidazole glycerol phosphate synthase subunit HisF [Clostridia bacterium]
MYTKRIIPCLDINKGRVVKGINFLDLIDAGDPVETAKAYNAKGADELVFLDITASYEKRDITLSMVEKVASEVFIPFTVGGGIRTTDDFNALLRAGADKVSVNTAGILNPSLISKASELFGSQCVVAAIDAKREEDGSYMVYINGGRDKTSKNAVEWAKECEKLGAGEILLTSMDADGTKKGFELSLTAMVSEAVSIPVIASGGAGSINDFYDVLTIGKADAALAASLFHFHELDIIELKQELKNKGIPVRI